MGLLHTKQNAQQPSQSSIFKVLMKFYGDKEVVA